MMRWIGRILNWLSGVERALPPHKNYMTCVRPAVTPARCDRCHQNEAELALIMCRRDNGEVALRAQRVYCPDCLPEWAREHVQAYGLGRWTHLPVTAQVRDWMLRSPEKTRRIE